MLQRSPETLSLAEQLKSATASLHRQVESSSFMSQLLQGAFDRGRYVSLLVNLQAIYQALEAGLSRHATHPAIAALALPGLYRSEALACDLALIDVEENRNQIALVPATRDYVQRLQTLASGQAHLLTAHAYVRYLGDLYGGQALRAVVRKALGLEGAPGTTFYDFGDANNRLRLRREFRAGLDTLETRVQAPSDIVSEAVDAFGRHQTLFAELAAST